MKTVIAFSVLLLVLVSCKKNTPSDYSTTQSGNVTATVSYTPPNDPGYAYALYDTVWVNLYDNKHNKLGTKIIINLPATVDLGSHPYGPYTISAAVTEVRLDINNGNMITIPLADSCTLHLSAPTQGCSIAF